MLDLTYLLLPFIGCCLTLLLVPLAVRLAPWMGTVDEPGADTRRVHSDSTPRNGGLVIVAGLIAALLVTGAAAAMPSGLWLGLGILLFAGVWDDIRGLRPVLKLIAQTGAAACGLLLSGIALSDVTIPLIDVTLTSTPLCLCLTLLIGTGIINAINLIDGLDGLAGGIGLAACLALAALAHLTGNQPVLLLSLATAGSLAGFLAHNSHPASIFMGDTGSMILGYLIAWLSFASIAPLPGTGAEPVSLMVPLLLLVVPWADTIWVMINRLIKGHHPFRADKTHIHHYILLAGLPHHLAVLLLLSISCGISLLALALRNRPDDVLFLMILVLIQAVIGGLRVFHRTSAFQMLRYRTRRMRRSRRHRLEAWANDPHHARLCMIARAVTVIGALVLMSGATYATFHLPNQASLVTGLTILALIGAAYLVACIATRRFLHRFAWALGFLALATLTYFTERWLHRRAPEWMIPAFRSAQAFALIGALLLCHRRRLLTELHPTAGEVILLWSTISLAIILPTWSDYARTPRPSFLVAEIIAHYFVIRTALAGLGLAPLRQRVSTHWGRMTTGNGANPSRHRTGSGSSGPLAARVLENAG